jgi:hypothetical protein
MRRREAVSEGVPVRRRSAMIYCEPKSDEALLGEVAGSERVFLLGCDLCANVGYCVHNGLESPAFAGLEGAVNVKQEIKRLKRVLAERGVHTGSATMIALCLISRRDQQQIIRKTDEFETVVTLSCDIGRQNVEGFLKDKRVVAAMTNRGFMRAIVDQHGLTIRIDKDRLYINNKKYSGPVGRRPGSD